MQYVGQTALFSGTKTERKRAKDDMTGSERWRRERRSRGREKHARQRAPRTRQMTLYQDPQGVVNGHPLTAKGL